MDIRLSRLDQHGALGENLTIEGIVEDLVFVGDVWKISDVELEVTAPRETFLSSTQSWEIALQERRCFLRDYVDGIVQ